MSSSIIVDRELDSNVQEFASLFKPVLEAILEYRSGLDGGSALPTEPIPAMRERLQESFNFDEPMAVEDVIRRVGRSLRTGAVHTPHPRYFGLFNPDVHPICVAADAMVAAFNPQLAAFSHSPAANTMEQMALSVFRTSIGWPESHATFTTGGSEANHSAVIVALTDRFPTYGNNGVSVAPVLYVSAEAHHSFVKIAHACGIGRRAIREIPVDRRLCMLPEALRQAITEDQASGRSPFAVVATAGTTAAGAIDPIPEIATICAAYNLWLHIDAAWGGGVLLSNRLRHLLSGIELADSVTVDAHKWFSVPMGAGMFFCKHPAAVHAAFGIQTSYMPAATDTPDPYLSTIQWSRRFTGLKLFMALAVLGLPGYERVIEHQADMGEYLKSRLVEEGFPVVNDTGLPLVCFQVPGKSLQEVVDEVYKSGSAWISRTVISHHGEVLRACITNFRTQKSDIETLIQVLKGIQGVEC
jgi:glutamate/tyrosine decarboxylase-like PLP-dependent enzyme